VVFREDDLGRPDLVILSSQWQGWVVEQFLAGVVVSITGERLEMVRTSSDWLEGVLQSC
jgi:hypothetical protein